MLGDWVERMFVARETDRATFFRNLERGLAQSKCHTCERLREGTCFYTTCRIRDFGRAERERSY
jgi:hypothetical protein